MRRSRPTFRIPRPRIGTPSRGRTPTAQQAGSDQQADQGAGGLGDGGPTETSGAAGEAVAEGTEAVVIDLSGRGRRIVEREVLEQVAQSLLRLAQVGRPVPGVVSILVHSRSIVPGHLCVSG